MRHGQIVAVRWPIVIRHHYLLHRVSVSHMHYRHHDVGGPECFQSGLHVHLLLLEEHQHAFTSLLSWLRLQNLDLVGQSVWYFKCLVEPSLLDIEDVQVTGGEEVKQFDLFLSSSEASYVESAYFHGSCWGNVL